MNSNVQNFLREFDELLKKYSVTDILPVYIQDNNEHYIGFYSNDTALTINKYNCGEFYHVNHRIGNIKFE